MTSDAASSSYTTETFDAACGANGTATVCSHFDVACDALPLPTPVPCVDCPAANARATSSDTHSTTLAAELSAVFDALADRDTLLDAANVAVASARAGEGEALDSAGALSEAFRACAIEAEAARTALASFEARAAIEAEAARAALATSEARAERAAVRTQGLRETLAQVAHDADEAVACARSGEAAAETRAATAIRSAVVARARSEELVAALGLMTAVLHNSDGGGASLLHTPIDATRLAAVRAALAERGGGGGREGSGGELAESITALATSVGAAGGGRNITSINTAVVTSVGGGGGAGGGGRLTSPPTKFNTTPRSHASGSGGRLRAQGRVRAGTPSGIVAAAEVAEVAAAAAAEVAAAAAAAAVVVPVPTQISSPPPPPSMRALSTLSQDQRHHPPLCVNDEGLDTTGALIVGSSCSVTIALPPTLPRTRSHTPSSSSSSLARTTTPQTHLVARGVTNQQVTSPRALLNLR
jgi:hypothetical protein